MDQIVTGHISDLRFSESGKKLEFPVAHSFLMLRWCLWLAGPGEWMGLNVPAQDLATVPGNHYHWNGRRVPPGAYHGGILKENFEKTPWRKL